MSSTNGLGPSPAQLRRLKEKSQHEKDVAVIEELRAENAELHADLDEITRKSDAAMRAAVAKHARERDELKRTVSALEGTVSALEGKVAHLDASLEDHADAIDGHHEDKEKLTAIAHSAATKVKGLHEEHARALATMEKEKLELLQKIAQEQSGLETELDLARSEHSAMVEELLEHKAAPPMDHPRVAVLEEELVHARTMVRTHVQTLDNSKAHHLALNLARNEAKATIEDLRGELNGANKRVEALLDDEPTRALTAQVRRLELELRDAGGRGGRGARGGGHSGEGVSALLAESALLNTKVQELHSELTVERGRRLKVMASFGDAVPRSDHVAELQVYEHEVVAAQEACVAAVHESAQHEAAVEREAALRYESLTEAAGARHRFLEAAVEATESRCALERTNDAAMIEGLQVCVCKERARARDGTHAARARCLTVSTLPPAPTRPRAPRSFPGGDRHARSEAGAAVCGRHAGARRGGREQHSGAARGGGGRGKRARA
jgi:predicted  nucleic acid-binding Zn-ribbon protein